MAKEIRVSSFHRLMAERGISQGAEIARNNTRWSTSNDSGNSSLERKTEESSSSTMGFELFAGNRGTGMRGSRGEIFARTIASMPARDEGEQRERRDDWSREHRGEHRGEQRDRRSGTGRGTWKIEDLHSVKSSVPEEVKKVIPKMNEFPELEMGQPSSQVGQTTSQVEKKVVWGSKKEVIESIKSSSMEELNSEVKKRRIEEKYQEYLVSQEEQHQELMAKKKKEWINRLKKQYAKDCVYRSIEDILAEEDEPYYITGEEVDPLSYLEDQMYQEATGRQQRIENREPIDMEWYYRETDLTVWSEWSREDNKEDYDTVEKRVWRNDCI